MHTALQEQGACAQRVQRFSAVPWTVACQAPLSMGFPRQEYWSGMPLPPPGDLPRPAIQPMAPETPALAGVGFIYYNHMKIIWIHFESGFFTTALPGKCQEEGRQPRWTHRENFMFSFSCRVLKYKFDQNEDVSRLIRRNIMILDSSQ